MARLTISQLTVELEHLRSLCAQQETRIRCDANSIKALKNQIDQMASTLKPITSTEELAAVVALSSPVSMTMGELSLTYCARFQQRVCTVDELKNYAQLQGIQIKRSF